MIVLVSLIVLLKGTFLSPLVSHILLHIQNAVMHMNDSITKGTSCFHNFAWSILISPFIQLNDFYICNYTLFDITKLIVAFAVMECYIVCSMPNNYTSAKRCNPLSNTIKDTSTIMRNPLPELCREGYA